MIQDLDFPNPLLRQNFEGVEVEKINERTVRFRLEQPYSFFPSNLTLGILPARAFDPPDFPGLRLPAFGYPQPRRCAQCSEKRPWRSSDSSAIYASSVRAAP